MRVRPVPEQFYDGTQTRSGHNKSTCKSMAVAMPTPSGDPGRCLISGKREDSGKGGGVVWKRVRGELRRGQRIIGRKIDQDALTDIGI